MSDKQDERKKKLSDISKKLRINNINELRRGEVKEVAKFLNPSPLCNLCNSVIAYEINKAWIEKPEKQTIKSFVKKWATRFENETGNKLTVTKFSFHINHHFNAKGSAVQKYNELLERQEQEKEFSKDKPTQDPRSIMKVTPQMRRLHNLLEDKYLNDLKVLDFGVREQLVHLQELKEIKEQRKAEENPYGIEKLIMQEEEIIKSLQNLALTKIKTFQTGKLQEAQANVLNAVGVMNNQTMGLLGLSPEAAVSPKLVKKSQFMFINTIIKHFLERLGSCLDVLDIPSEKRAIFYNALKEKLEGIEDEVFKDFQSSINDANMMVAEVVEHDNK